MHQFSNTEHLLNAPGLGLVYNKDTLDRLELTLCWESQAQKIIPTKCKPCNECPRRRGADPVPGVQGGPQRERVTAKLTRRTSQNLPTEEQACQVGRMPCDWVPRLEGAWKVGGTDSKLSAWLVWGVRDG